MGPLAQQCIETFWASISRPFAKQLLEAIVESYSQADAESREEYPPPEAHYMRGHKCRAGVEVRIRGVAALDREASAASQWNKPHNQTHTLLTRGLIKLTCSRADSRDAIVRSSLFRRDYAAQSQLLLFPEDEPSSPDPGPYLFAMIIHGVDQKDPTRPAFVEVVFPDREYQTYITRINLLTEFPDIFGDMTPPPVGPTDPIDPLDQDPDPTPDPTVKLRPDRKVRRVKREREA